MSASPSWEWCHRCDQHVDDCDCSRCCGDRIMSGCGVTIARWFEPDDGWCSKCRAKRAALEVCDVAAENDNAAAGCREGG